MNRSWTLNAGSAGHCPADYAATLLRLSLGTMYLAHAGLKLWVFTLAGTAAFFRSFGFPGWSAYGVFAAEVVGGVLLLAGWRTRAVSLALVPVLLGAIWVHSGNGWVFTSTGGGWEYPALLVAISLVQSLLGDGAFAASGKLLSRVDPRAQLIEG